MNDICTYLRGKSRNVLRYLDSSGRLDNSQYRRRSSPSYDHCKKMTTSRGEVPSDLVLLLLTLAQSVHAVSWSIVVYSFAAAAVVESDAVVVAVDIVSEGLRDDEKFAALEHFHPRLLRRYKTRTMVVVVLIVWPEFAGEWLATGLDPYQIFSTLHGFEILAFVRTQRPPLLTQRVEKFEADN